MIQNQDGKSNIQRFNRYSASKNTHSTLQEDSHRQLAGVRRFCSWFQEQLALAKQGGLKPRSPVAMGRGVATFFAFVDFPPCKKNNTHTHTHTHKNKALQKTWVPKPAILSLGSKSGLQQLVARLCRHYPSVPFVSLHFPSVPFMIAKLGSQRLRPPD